MNAQLITATAAVETLVSEGYAQADVLAAYDSLIESGLKFDTDDNAITADELQVLRDQLDS